MHKDINVAVGGPINANYPKVYVTKFLKPTIPFALQVTEPNTKYVIKHDFDLGGGEVTIPESCLIEFDGGSLSNGIIVLNNTKIFPTFNDLFGNNLIILGNPAIGTYKYSDGNAWFFNGEEWKASSDQEALDELNNLIQTKADKSTTLAGYGINDAYTKNEVDSAINTLENNITGGSDKTIDQVNSSVSAVNAEMEALKNGSTSTIKDLDNAIAVAESDIEQEESRAKTKEEQLLALYESLSSSQPVPKTAEEWAEMTEWEEGVIYRVSGTASYTDYMYNGTTTIPMATYNNATDEIPIKNSDNIISSGGVYGSMMETNEYLNSEIGLYNNLFNANGSGVKPGTFLDYTDGVTLHDYEAWNTSGFIEINPYLMYDLVCFIDNVKGTIINGHIYGYDKDKVFVNISSVDFGSTQQIRSLQELLEEYPIPSNVRYIRLSFTVENWQSTVFGISKWANSLTKFAPYSDKKIADVVAKNSVDITKNSNDIKHLDAEVSRINKFIGNTDINLFNQNDKDVALGKYLDYNNGTTLLDYATWNTTGYIEINPDSKYNMVSFEGGFPGNIKNGHIYGYDSEKNFIDIARSDFGSVQYYKTLEDLLTWFPIPSNVRFVRFSFTIENWTNTVFGLSDNVDNLTEYVPYFSSDIAEIQKDILELQEEVDSLDTKGSNYNNIVKSINRIADGTPYPLQTVDGYKYVVRTYGYKTLLCDLMFTSDNVPVLSHDFYLNQYYGNVRLLGGGTIPDPSVESNRVYISRTTFQTLYSNYDFGIYKGDKFAGIRIQRFEDFVKMCRMLDCDIYVEVKEATTSQMEIALGIVRKYNMQNKTSWTADFNNTGKSIMRALTSILPTTRVSLMPTANLTTSHVDGVAELKTGQNEVFLFGWNTTNLTNQIVSYMIEKGVAFEMGTLNTAQDIINYFARSDAQKYCTGIETQTIIAGKVMYDNNI